MLFSAGCPHCKNAVPHFITAAETFKEDRKVRHNLMKENFPYQLIILLFIPAFLIFFLFLSGAVIRDSPVLMAQNLSEFFHISCLLPPLFHILMQTFNFQFLILQFKISNICSTCSIQYVNRHLLFMCLSSRIFVAQCRYSNFSTPY